MAGLYIHIPFCKSRCIYCSFYSTTDSGAVQRYTDAICREMELRKDYLASPPTTIYIGGGTPSRLTDKQLEQIFGSIDRSCAEEVTIECNPDDVTAEFAATLASLPVNRVSMGAQTFDDSRLRFIRRRHNAREVDTAVNHLRQAGIDNISLDLMYGFPNETIGQWIGDIAHALLLAPGHISAYSLTYEENTPLYDMLRQGRIRETDEETSRAMYEELIDRLAAAGYEHYEISNFALPGRRSRHNSSYWQTVPYLGIGAAAHSFDIRSRQWNVADINTYMESIECGEIPMERETLDTDTRYNDTVMLSLRTCEGIDLDCLSHNFGCAHTDFCMRAAGKYIAGGLLERNGNHIRLTRRGLFVSDMVMADLMRI